MTERELFEAALDQEPDDRAAFLEQVCAVPPNVKGTLGGAVGPAGAGRQLSRRGCR